MGKGWDWFMTGGGVEYRKLRALREGENLMKSMSGQRTVQQNKNNSLKAKNNSLRLEIEKLKLKEKKKKKVKK